MPKNSELQDVNARLQRMKIQGNDYVDVAQRVQGFWALYPDGTIETTWLVLQPDYCVCQATLKNGGAIIAQGTADERRDTSKINRTSMVEVCETSAVGRACGIAGIGSVENMASAEELAHALTLQNEQKPQPKPQQKPKGDDMRALYTKAKALGLTDKEIHAALVLAVGSDKNTREYNPQEMQAARACLEGMIAQAGGQQ